MTDCECATWARDDYLPGDEQNDHHRRCPLAKDMTFRDYAWFCSNCLRILNGTEGQNP